MACVSQRFCEGDYWEIVCMALRTGRGSRVDNSFGILGRAVSISVREGVMGYLLGM